MTHEAYVKQVQRLFERFGRKNFDDEFVNLVWREVLTLHDQQFTRICDFFIGSRQPNKPPLLADFRDQRVREEKSAFTREVQAAANVLNWPGQGGLKAFLTKHYPGCRTLNEAVEVRKLHRAIARSEGRNPDLEPHGGIE